MTKLDRQIIGQWKIIKEHDANGYRWLEESIYYLMNALEGYKGLKDK